MRTLGEPLTDDERRRFIRAAREQVGVRFRHAGRGAFGVDCAGAIVVALQAIGRLVDDASAYGRSPDGHTLQAMLRRNLGEPVAAPWRPGDVPLMRFGAGKPTHVGILGDYPGGLSLIHAYNVFQRVVEHRLDARWQGRIIEAYRP